MKFAKIENNRCVNVVEFDNSETALGFDNTLIEIEKGFGIGDIYDGEWHKYQKTDEEIAKERIREIDSELAQIDSQGVTRHFENQVEASGTYEVIYESTRNLIDRKNELRQERKILIQKGEM